MLNVPCYDQELIEKNAAESGFAKEFVAEYGEAPLRPGGFPMFLQSEIITATPCRMTFGSFSGRSSYHWQKKDPV